MVLGFGNVLLGDDGAGVRLVELLRTDPSLGGCTFVDGGTISFNLLSYIDSTARMLVIDAAELHQPPGAHALFEDDAMDAFLKSTRRRTVHEVGLIDLLDMARMEDCLPERRALLCIQPAQIGWSEALSPIVSRALHDAADQARRLIWRWTQP
jgi:hydrogenase maturation protease